MSARGFAQAEYEARLTRAQALMSKAGLGGLLLTTEPEIRYFTGFLTRFWESPSRPWFLIVPAAGDPVAVIPSIGAALMGRTWITDIRTWPAPRPGDDGVSLLAATLDEVAEGPVGIPSGPETHLRMPQADFARLRAKTARFLRDDAGITARLRAVKSGAEIDRIAHACRIAARAFARVPEIAAPGMPLSQVFRRFQMLLLEEGADWVPYLAGGAGPLGYADVISPADDRPLARGDVLMLDTGALWDGYFCDYDRNFAMGTPDPRVLSAHDRLLGAAQAGLEAAQPGARACDVHAAMARICGADEGAGRLGHGLGMQLTEGLSLTAADRTVLEPGMVITLEPGVETGGGNILVHEENVVIRQGGAQILSPWADTLARLA
ncbi:Xaa-Pro aminopeptidase [Lutimaribacter pacificus]|uniref:Xaa-Pro aminopeptidase n=1 Tax=Lutimaribacter pacificus TaxID=391948 RepID=A0A1H0F132_9RHOB|nr:Xaa-Pro peptidase family protein [Lutimaribacter pacificus]SDN88364.1 Xaa-Pro aminopeptidase [Lutimaribacter pacificus]SHK43457.1 Xaa-Pro aminopeptidase [Lutimaribacter pacificus]